MGVKVEVFDIFSYFGLYFLAESVLLDGFHAKEFHFEGFVEFQFFVFAKWPILFKKWVSGRFSILHANFNLKPFAKVSTLTVIIILGTFTENLSSLA